MSLSTHILDTHTGRPIAELPIVLEHLHEARWQVLCNAVTGPDGRTRDFPATLLPGIYRLHFETAPYFAAQGLFALHPYIEIAFTIVDPAPHLHIPLLLTANGYTTYRGT